MKASDLRLLFFGSDAFSIRVLRHLLEKDICAIGVATKPRSQLSQFSSENKLPQFGWPLASSTLRHPPFNIGLVASFGELLDVNTINSFKHGLFNVHPSLLPQYRGSTPIQAAIRDGLEQTGVTIIKIPPVAKFDIGQIVLQRELRIKSKEYAIDLRDRLADVGASMSIELLEDLEGCLLKMRPQGVQLKSYAKKLKREDGLLRFKQDTSLVVERKVRAYTGFLDLATICLNGLKVKLEGLREADEVLTYKIDHLLSSGLIEPSQPGVNIAQPGAMSFHKLRHLLVIKCQDDRWIGFDYVTPESKSRMTALDFYNGFLSKTSPVNRHTDI